MTDFLCRQEVGPSGFGSEQGVRAAFEKCLADNSYFRRSPTAKEHPFSVFKPAPDLLDSEAADDVPLVCVCVQGGPGTVGTVLNAVMQDIPALLVRGSGKASDLLSDAVLLKRIAHVAENFEQQQLWALGGMTTGMGVNVSSAMGVHQAAYPPPPHQAPHVFHQQAAFGTAQIGHARSPTGVVPDAGAVAMAAGTVGATPAGMGASVGGVNVAQQQSAVYNGALNIMFNNPSAVAAMQQQLGVGVGASVAGATQHQQPGQQLLTMQQPVNDFSSAMAAGMSSAAGGAGVPFGLGLPRVYSAGNLSDTMLGVSPFARATSAALQTAGGGRGIAVTPTSMEQYSPKDASLDYKSWQREGLVVDGAVRGKGAPGVADEAGSGGGPERKRGRGKARLFDPSPTSSKRQRQLATELRRQVASGYGAATGTARAPANGRRGGGNEAGAGG